MTFQQFLEKWDGEYCEVAGSANAKNQCVDLANAYIRDVLGLPIIEWTNAVDFPTKWQHEIIENTTDAIPKEGDLIVWKTNHIAIFLEGTKYNFKSFDQNYPLYSPCHAQGHYYNNVEFFLRYNKPIEDMTEAEKKILQYIKETGATEGDVRQGVAYVKDGTVSNLEKDVGDLKDSLNSLEEKVVEINLKLEDKQDSIEDYQKKLETANKQITKLLKDNEALDNERKQYKAWYEAKCQETADKLNSWELLKLLISKLSWRK